MIIYDCLGRRYVDDLLYVNVLVDCGPCVHWSVDFGLWSVYCIVHIVYCIALVGGSTNRTKKTLLKAVRDPREIQN